MNGDVACSLHEENVIEVESPLTFFVHVPKTAGSTVNATLSGVNPNGRVHCEDIIQNREALSQAANTLDWMSGHVDLTTAERAMKAVTERPIHFYSCMREPVAQVASHYNWLIEIFHKGMDFYDKHPDKIKEISAKIRESDNNCPETIVLNLKLFSGLFLNCQSRFILGRQFNWNSGTVCEQLAKYSFFTDNNLVKELINKITGSQIEELSNQNKSRYHFNMDVFKDPMVKNFLKKNNALDQILYDIGPVRTLEGNSKSNKSKRTFSEGNITEESMPKKALYDPDLAEFCTKSASTLNSIDLASANWVTDFSELGFKNTGTAKLYPDHRIRWLISQYGSLREKSILELGSLEGAHSIQLSEAHPREIIAIEANEAHFLKSLIIKNAENLENVQFLLGDFQKYMETCDRSFDIVSACGVLYHMPDPGKMLAAAATLSDTLFLWTVIYNEQAIPDGHRRLISGKVSLKCGDFTYEGYKHHYRAIDATQARKDQNFSGGLENYAIWLDKDQLYLILKNLGFSKFHEKLSPPNNPRHGQNILLLAQK